MLDRLFGLAARGVTVGTELEAALPGSPVLHPFVRMVGGYAVIAAPDPITDAALMAQGTAGIDLKDFSEVFPAFFIMIALPLSCSMGDGPAAGFITAAVLLLCLVVVRGGMS